MEIHQLVEKAKAGDRNAFAELVARYQKVAITKAWNVIHDFHLAQDTSQEAFVIAFKRLDSLKNSAAFGPWLLEIVRRHSLKVVSRQETFRPLYEDESCKQSLPDWHERHADVVQAIKQLPDHEQDVVVLYYMEELSTKQVAESVDRPVGTVTKQLSRAINRIRNLLTEASRES